MSIIKNLLKISYTFDSLPHILPTLTDSHLNPKSLGKLFKLPNKMRFATNRLKSFTSKSLAVRLLRTHSRK